MNYLPEVYRDFKRQFPEIAKAYDDLAIKCHDWGPLDQKTRQLVKLGIAIGQNSEGAIKSHTRRALEESISADEIRHTVLMALTTAGYPTMIAAIKWVDEVISKHQ